MNSSKLTLLIIVLAVFGIFSLKANSPKGTKDWTIVESYTITGKSSGLAWDGTYLYFGIYGTNGDKVYRFDPQTGTEEFLFSNPLLEDAFGMTYDGENLWITDHANSSALPAYAMEFDMSGNILSQFDLPDHYMSGIAYDEGDFWVATYYPDPSTIYKVDTEGNIIVQMQSPGDQPWDLCLENGNLWVVDYNDNMIYKINSGGVLEESYPCENIKPAGIVFDGQYLWYLDGPLSSPSTLYKVDLGGSGTPEINVPVTEYNYGNVAVGDSAVWNCTVSNSGADDLEVSNLIIQNAVPIFVDMVFPQVLSPGNSIDIPFKYKPTEIGSLNTLVTIESNDPITPEVEVLLEGEAVFDGPHINVPILQHNYGTVRVNSTTRWFLEIYNDGNESLEISGIAIDDSHFYLDSQISFPVSIGALETIELGVWFQPAGAVNYFAIAEINHNDISQDAIEVELSGNGTDEDYQIGENLWQYTINTGWDNSIKGIVPIEDVSGDGFADVITSSEDDVVRCFNGNSSGIGDVLWENEVGSVYGQNGLTVIEDINNDGVDDVVAGLVWGVKAVKALSGKTGEQIWVFDTHSYGDGGWVYQVCSGFDYNEDGIKDVLASTGNDGNNTGPKRFFCLDGTNGNMLWEAYTDGPNFSIIGVSDFTGDGKPDAIGGSSNNGETVGKVFGINGSNGSLMFEYSTTGSSVWGLTQLDDINGDGIQDIAAGDFGGYYYLLDPSNGNVIQSGVVNNSLILRFEKLDDVNGDGYVDFSMAHSGSNAVVIDGYTGDNIWLSGLADKCWNIDRIPDVSGDGINDLIAGTLFSNNQCYFLNGVTGEVLWSNNFGEAIDGIGAIPDITGDGSWEMVVGGREGNLKCFSGGLNSAILSADFIADTTYGFIPFDVNFTDLSTGEGITNWEWDFDNDGAIDSDEQNPTFSYSTFGVFTVRLIVSNELASDTMVKNAYITADSTVGLCNHKDDFVFNIFPNPFNDYTTISYKLDKTSEVRVEIYSVEGRHITTLLPLRKQLEGDYKLQWNRNNNEGRQSERGAYIIRFTIDEETSVKKLMVY